MVLPMTVPLWVLLAFAGWTLAVLTFSIGVYRWYRILGGSARIAEWRADQPSQGPAWYQRAMRAHMNCVENLPVYGAIAVIAALAGVGGPGLDALALTLLGARIGQSLVHIALEQTETVAALRFGLFFVQVACMVAMGALIVLRA
jgi:uncharacterized MAPEG superfamily protein